MSDRAERWPRAVHAMGIYRRAALQQPTAVPDEPRRHRAAGLLRRQFVLAKFVFLHAAGAGARQQGCRRHRRAFRQSADGRADRVRHGPRTPGSRRGRAAHPGQRTAGQTDHSRRVDEEQLAEVFAPVSTGREILSGFVQADAAIVMGRLSGRRVRQHHARERDARLCAAGADRAAQEQGPADHRRQGRPGQQDRHDLHRRHLRRRRAQGYSPRNGQEAAAADVSFRLPEHGRAAGHYWHGRPLGHQARDRHGAGPRRRLGQVFGAGQHADFLAAARRGGQGPAIDAKLDHRHAGRIGFLRRLSSVAESGAAAFTNDGPNEAGQSDRAVVRTDPRLQLPARSAAGHRPPLRQVSRRKAAGGRQQDRRPARHGQDQRLALGHAG